MLRILVADDAPMVRAGLKLLLETVGARGYIAKVYIPTDLVPAIEAAIDFPPVESPAL
jgi:CheY-like chemotaxis protein